MRPIFLTWFLKFADREQCARDVSLVGNDCHQNYRRHIRLFDFSAATYAKEESAVLVGGEAGGVVVRILSLHVDPFFTILFFVGSLLFLTVV